jgi:hypothetical protein
MKPFPHKMTPMTMEYLDALTAEGTPPVDVLLSLTREDIAMMDVFFADGTFKIFYMEWNGETLQHYKDAIEHVGYGPRGLANLIHMEVVARSKEQGVSHKSGVIGLSPDLVAHFGKHLDEWGRYGYKFVQSEACHGMSYVIGFSEDSKD